MTPQAGPKPSSRRRAAAIGALIAFVATVAFVAAILLRAGGWLVVALAGFALMVGGAWWIATERMPRRAIGAVGAGVGAAAIVVSIARTIDGVAPFLTRVLVLAALLAVLTLCARAAMAPDLHRVELPVRGEGPPQHAVLLCNPWSGGGKVQRFGLVDLAEQLGVETVLLDRGLDLEQLARDAVRRGADCLGMAGGDGSQALVASIAIEHRLPFVCVSAGTRNHFALDLGLNRDDPRDSMLAFRDACERHVDYATVNGRLFVNNVSLGVYAEIVQESAYREAKRETTATLLPELLGRRSEPFDLQFTTPDGAEVDGAILIMVSNNPYVIDMSASSMQRTRLDEGKLGVFAVTTRTGSEAAALLTATAVGLRRRSAFWKEFTPTTFEVRSRSGQAFAGVDGEALDLPTPLRFESHPGGLTLLVPKHNIAAAELRRARHASIRDLVALAAGHDPYATG